MKEFLGKVWRFLWKTVLWFLGLSVATVIVYRWVPVPVTPLMIIRCVEQKMDGKPLKLKKDWEPLENINNNLQLAVVCSEDQHFVEHSGFDFEAIDKAIKYNERPLVLMISVNANKYIHTYSIFDYHFKSANINNGGLKECYW